MCAAVLTGLYKTPSIGQSKGCATKDTRSGPPVSLSFDAKACNNGYPEGGEAHRIVISEWALDSEMLGGLSFMSSPTYISGEGLTPRRSDPRRESSESSRPGGTPAKETEYLIDAFTTCRTSVWIHRFAVMEEKELDWQGDSFGVGV